MLIAIFVLIYYGIGMIITLQIFGGEEPRNTDSTTVLVSLLLWPLNIIPLLSRKL